MPQQLRAVIFDIGRVLVRLDIARSLAGLSRGLSLSPDEIWSSIQTDPRWHDWQEGRIAPHDWHLHLTRDRKSTRLNSSHYSRSRMPSSA